MKRKNYLAQLLGAIDTSGSQIDTMPNFNGATGSTSTKQREFSKGSRKDKASRRQRNKNKNKNKKLRKHRRNRNKKTRPRRDLVVQHMVRFLENNDSDDIIAAFKEVVTELPAEDIKYAMDIVTEAAKKCECEKCKFRQLADA